MPEAVLSTDQIVTATEEVLRRYGVEKTNVVDVARVLGVSHTNIYRRFPSKKALLDAVANRWLQKIILPLQAIADDRTQTAAVRLLAWFDTLRIAKRHKVLDDPELFRVYHRLAMAAGDLANEHIAGLLGQVESIIADGVAEGDFARRLNAKEAAQACLNAMTPFHHPALLVQGEPRSDDEAHALLALLLAGLRAGPVPLPVS